MYGYNVEGKDEEFFKQQQQAKKPVAEVVSVDAAIKLLQAGEATNFGLGGNTLDVTFSYHPGDSDLPAKHRAYFTQMGVELDALVQTDAYANSASGDGGPKSTRTTILDLRKIEDRAGMKYKEAQALKQDSNVTPQAVVAGKAAEAVIKQ